MPIETESADAPAPGSLTGGNAAPVDPNIPEEANPKKLVVFCDGTWNDLRMRDITNVARLAKCVLPKGEMSLGKGKSAVVAQVVFYDDGVGVAESVSPVVDGITKILGGTVGAGLNDKIEKAYRFIVLNYNQGDEIYIFGFSRGAYTARSLCGLIRKCGVLRRSNFEKVPEAVAFYQNSANPADSKSRIFRQNYSHPIISGPEDYTDEDRKIIAECQAAANVSPEVKVVPEEIRRRGVHIRYLGVWDTVGEMGLPPKLGWFSRESVKKYRFHDLEATSLIQSIRHGVAVDELRKLFDVTPFANIHELNLEWAAALADKQVGNSGAVDYEPYDRRPYQQRWFPGDHGSVGGGNPEPGLSSAALLWIAEGAHWAGLSLDVSSGSELNEAKRLQQPCANWKIDKAGVLLPPGKTDIVAEIGGSLRRNGPLTFDEVHESARERWRRDPTYRPTNLTRFAGLKEMEPVNGSSGCSSSPPIGGTP